MRTDAAEGSGVGLTLSGAHAADDPVTAQYRRAFKQAQIRAYLNWALIGSLPLIGWLSSGMRRPLVWTVPQSPVWIGLFAAGLWYHWRNWRCPRCGIFQGRWIFSTDCESCGLTGS